MSNSGTVPRPLGAFVDAGPARRPTADCLEGRFVKLEPLNPAKHADALWANVQGAAQVWDYLFDRPFSDAADLRADLARKSASVDPMFWAVVDKGAG